MQHGAAPFQSLICDAVLLKQECFDAKGNLDDTEEGNAASICCCESPQSIALFAEFEFFHFFEFCLEFIPFQINDLLRRCSGVDVKRNKMTTGPLD